MYHRECCDVVPSPNFSYAYLHILLFDFVYCLEWKSFQTTVRRICVAQTGGAQ